jgi:DNA-binding transcriptional LysR family regulator
VRPFFGNLEAVAAKLSQRAEPQLRIGASEIVLRDHLPQLLAQVRAGHPRLRITLRSGFQAQMETALQEREIDLAITPLESRLPPRFRCLRLVRLPLVLLVPKALKIKSAAELWPDGAVPHPLISLPATETLSRVFRKGLQRLKVDWPVSMEASSLDLITRYVANDYGIGVRVIELPEFERIEITAFWNGTPTLILRDVLTATQRYATTLWPDWCCDDELK